MNSFIFRLRSQVGNIRKNNDIEKCRVVITPSFGHQQSSRFRYYHGMIQRQKTRYFTSCNINILKRYTCPALCVTGIYVVGKNWEANLIPNKCEEDHASKMLDTRISSSVHSSLSRGRWNQLRQKVYRNLRLFGRVVKLMLALTPVVALYPFQYLSHRNDSGSDAHEMVLASLENKMNRKTGWYFRLCLSCVEWSGAAVIKLMQWASSRPDMFGNDFCDAFAKLQDNTTPHAMKYTEEVLRQAYGDKWAERIQLEKNVVGSGCIGQVYKGTVKNSDDEEKHVAVKVMHPNVTDAIADDLELIRYIVKLAQILPFDMFANLRWLNPEGVLEEFADLLQLQLDLRIEAKNLERFNENFKDDERVAFPRLIKGFEPHQQVLIETFCEGEPVLKFIQENSNRQDVLSEMCLVGIRTVCKMLFMDNFMHGDMHPGNILINAKDRKYIILDAGIATEYSDADHELIVNILSSFIRQDGRAAGRLMIDDSNVRASMKSSNGDVAINETLYIDKIEALTNRANSKDYFMEHLGVYLTYICNAAAEHHVMMNQKFVTAALEIKVLEGLSLALDPSVEICKVANPIILKSEMSRKWSKASKELANLLGVGKFLPS